MGDDPDLRARRGTRDHAGERLDQVGVEAGLGLVQGDERRQSICQQRAREREVAQRAVGQFRGFEHALGIVGQDQPERGGALRLGHDELRARKCVADRAVEESLPYA